MSDNYKVYNDNCGLIIGRTSKKNNDIHVILKSQIFPNPNDGHFTIKFTSKLNKEAIEIRILDLSGKTLKKETRLLNDQYLNMALDLDNGSYLVQIKFNDGAKDIHKLIISK